MASPLNKNDFACGSLVFAKVKGYPFWPARVITIDKTSYKTVTKYEVEFFATNEKAWLNKIDVCIYSGNKGKYVLESVALKHRESFEKALCDIEKAWETQKKSNKVKKSPQVNMTGTSNKNLITPKLSIRLENKEKNQRSSIEESIAGDNLVFLSECSTELDLNRSFHIQEVENDEKLELTKQINQLEEQLKNSAEQYKSLLLEKHSLIMEVKNVTALNDVLKQENNKKETEIEKIKLNLDIIKKEFTDIEAKRSWGQDKWVDDTVLNAYFDAMAESTNGNDILFLGPSLTQAIRFSSPAPGMAPDCLQLTSFTKCKYVFLCVSDCISAEQDDSGSHWSLLFISRFNNKAYHFDSMNSMNKAAAHIVASNLGVHPSSVTEMPCIQQKNSFECGVHVLANSKYIANHYCVNKGNLPFTEWFTGKNLLEVVDHNKCKSTKPYKTAPTTRQTKKWHSVPIKHKSNTQIGCRNSGLPKRTIHSIINKNRFEILNLTENEDNNTSDIVHEPLTAPEITKKVKKIKVTDLSTEYISAPVLPIKPVFDNSKKPRITITSDSHGRSLSTYLEQINNGRFEIFNHCQPGAPLEQILISLKNSSRFKLFSKNDCVVVIGGTNNILHQSPSDRKGFLETFTNYMQKQMFYFKHTNLILATIPYRYDLNADSHENKLIKDANNIIRQLVYQQDHVQLLDLYLLQRYYHTRHGLHINRNGKKRICREIMEMSGFLLTAKSTESQTKTKSIPEKIVPVPRSVVPQCKARSSVMMDGIRSATDTQKTIHTNTIEVVDADMLDEIKEYNEDSSVAFAHCISGDFGDPRQMSAGVAIIFKNKFGRPKQSDCLNDCLTIQQGNSLAAVYGLVTKAIYSGKPTVNTYDKAFHHLTEDFRARQLKMLICSPMGCVRDLISPLQFARNIVNFHIVTGAAVRVVVSNERASRKLKNGLEHDEFINLLNCSITEGLILRRGLPLSSPTNEPSDLQPVTPTCAHPVSTSPSIAATFTSSCTPLPPQVLEAETPTTVFSASVSAKVIKVGEVIDVSNSNKQDFLD